MGFCPSGQGSFAWETWKFSICVQTSLKRGVAKKIYSENLIVLNDAFSKWLHGWRKKWKAVGHCHGEITSFLKNMILPFLFSSNYLHSCECFYQRSVGGRRHSQIKAHHTLEFIALLKEIRLFSNRGAGTSAGRTCVVVQLITAQSQLYRCKSAHAGVHPHCKQEGKEEVA